MVNNMAWKEIIKEDRPLQDAKEVGEYWGSTIGHFIAELLQKKLQLIGEAVGWAEGGDYDTTIDAVFDRLNRAKYGSNFRFVNYKHDRFELSNDGYVGGGVAEYKIDVKNIISMLENLKIESKDIENFLRKIENLKIKLDYSAEFKKPFSRVRMGKNQEYEINVRYNGNDEGMVAEEKVKVEVGEDSRTGKLSASGEGIVRIYGDSYITDDEFNEWGLLT